MVESLGVQKIRKCIYRVRGHDIMLDRDLAEFYNMKTFVLNQAVRRNARKFPDDFVFKLTWDELSNLEDRVENIDLEPSRSQNVILNKTRN